MSSLTLDPPVLHPPTPLADVAPAVPTALPVPTLPPVTAASTIPAAAMMPAVTTPLPEATAIARTMRLSILEGGVTQVFLNWTTGSVLVGYMLHFGASPTALALVASVPLLAQVASPFAAYLAGRAGKRKPLTVLTGLIGRGLWVLAALLPQLGVPPNLIPTVLVVLVALSSLFQSANGTLWAAWMGDVVPDKQRGRYFGLRAGVVGVVGMVANLAVGAFLDRVGAPLNFEVALLVAVGAALVALAILYIGHYEPVSESPRLSLRATFTLPLANANYRRFLLFAFYWQAAVLLAAPFVVPYFLSELGMSFTHIAIWGAIASTCALFSTSRWGRVADRVGNKAVLAISTMIAGVALPVCWILAGLTGHLGFIWASAVADAVAWGAIGPAMFNLALVSAPKTNRAAFIAMFSLATGVAGFLGGLASGPLLSLFLPHTLHVFGVAWTGYHTLFALSGVARMFAWVLLEPVQESYAWRTRDVLREIRHWRMSSFPWR